MLRILQVVASMDQGGIQAFLMNTYRKIDRNKVQFDFLLHTEKEYLYNKEIRNLGGKIFYIPARNKGIYKNRKALDEFFKTHSEYKIVHQHVSSLTYVEPLKSAKRHGVPTRIIHSHNTRQGGNQFHKYIHYLNQISVKSYATDYFACSELAAKWLYRQEQYKVGDYTIINNGIDAEKFIFNNKIREEKRKELGIKQSTFVLGHIGRFVDQKNHVFLIDIFKEVHEQYNDSILLLVGEGDLRRDMEQKVNKLGLQSSVIFTGICTEIPNILQAMDVFVFPSNYEGLGMVLIEAQASGLQCFTSDRVVPQEVDITGKVKFINLEESSQTWAEEISKYKHYNRENTLDEIINARYDISQIAKEIKECYELQTIKRIGH